MDYVELLLVNQGKHMLLFYILHYFMIAIQVNTGLHKTEVYAEELAYNTVQILGNPLYPLYYRSDDSYLKKRHAIQQVDNHTY